MVQPIPCDPRNSDFREIRTEENDGACNKESEQRARQPEILRLVDARKGLRYIASDGR